jgi:hypothetical protein
VRAHRRSTRKVCLIWRPLSEELIEVSVPLFKNFDTITPLVDHIRVLIAIIHEDGWLALAAQKSLLPSPGLRISFGAGSRVGISASEMLFAYE